LAQGEDFILSKIGLPLYNPLSFGEGLGEALNNNGEEPVGCFAIA